MRILYLFAGQPRRSDLKTALIKAGVPSNLDVDVVEYDILRSPEHDLPQEVSWAVILEGLNHKEYAAVFASPPCNIFFQGHLRATQWPAAAQVFEVPPRFPMGERLA